MATGNSPSVVGGTSSTDLVSVLDLHPEFFNTLIRRHGDQGVGIFGLMKSLGYMRGAAQEKYFHFEEDWHHNTIHVGAIVAPSTGAGTAAVVKLDAQDFDADGNFYVKLNDNILLPNDVYVTVIDVVVNGANDVDITIAPNQVANDIDAAVVFADLPTELAIISNSFAEGTGQPKSTVEKTIYDENYLQIIKETYSITGTEMNSKKFWSRLDDGRGLKGTMALSSLGAQMRFLLKTNMALLFGETTDNPLITGSTNLNTAGRAYNTTEGLIPYVRRCGNTLAHQPGTWTVAKFHQIERILDREGNGSDVMMLMGLNLALENSVVLKDYFADTNVNFVYKKGVQDLFGGSEGLAASVDFQCLRSGSRDYFFKKMPVFSHPKLVGAEGYSYSDRAIALPIGKRKVKDPGAGGTVMAPTFGMRYSKYTHDRMSQSWTTGAAGERVSDYTNDIDIKDVHFRAHIGFEGAGGNSMIMVE